MILLIDNYDSFVHNLARYVRELGADAVVRRNDALTLGDVADLAPSHIILSPGPCTPAEAGISTDVVRRFGPATPILGVCLGHQCIGAAYGGDIVRAGRPLHGRTSPIVHDGSSVFTGLPSPLRATRYHSLVIARHAVPASLRVLATAGDDGEIMAVAHRQYPVIGVQFHPESAASEYGYVMLERFLHGTRARAHGIPTGADGAYETPEARLPSTIPWAWQRDDLGGTFVPPPVDLVPVIATTLPAVWVNGVQVPADAAAVSARDRGLTLADGVFETMRVQHGRIFRLDRHLARLDHALATLEIPAVPDLRRWLNDAVAEPSRAAASVRLTVTRGVAAGGVTPPTHPRATVIIIVGPMPHIPRAVREQGLTAHVASGRRNERAMTAGLKTTAYTDAVLALIEAQKTGADEALFLDTEGHCSEATASNLFICRGSDVITPPITCGALPGITRATVMELAAVAGLQVRERAVGLDELIAADESFLTSSLRGIAPLVRVGRSWIGTGAPGALTTRLTAAYTALVDHECGVSTRT